MKMLLSSLAVFTFLFLTAFSGLPVSAMDLQADPAQKVYDYAGLLTESEEAALLSEMQEMDRTYQMEFVIVTIQDSEGLTSQDYAQDFFDYNDFGPDGLLLLINMQIRELWICGTGSGEYIFNDGQIQNILDDVYPEAADNDFYGACQSFLSASNQVARRANESIFQKNLRRIPFFFLAAASISGISLALMFSAHKLKRTAVHASQYADNGLQLTYQDDCFLRSAITKTRINTEHRSSGRGGGGGHIGSSGRSHSGGGRRF